jgi:iron(III) transport system substrate-binding protein
MYHVIFGRAAAILSLMVLVACSPAAPAATTAPSATAAPLTTDSVVKAAQAEGKLFVSDSSPEASFAPVLAAFKAKYPFIETQFLSMGGTDIIQRLRQEAQAKQPSVDVAIGGADQFSLLDQENNILHTDWAALGVPATVILSPAQVKAVGVLTIIFYNTSLVPTANAPKTWEDLLDPKWKGRIAVPVDNSIATDLSIVWGEQKTVDYWTRLVQNSVTIATAPEVGTRVAAGEFPLGVTRIQFARSNKAKGAPVDFVIPDPVPFPILTAASPATAAHPNAGRLFIQWLSTPEGADTYEKYNLRGNPFLPGTSEAQAVNGLHLAYWDGNPATTAQRVALADKFTEIAQRTAPAR